MEIFAHRGASAERPENTLAAFARALDLGAEGVELDVRLSIEGVAVVMHDATVDRTTNGTGPVDQLTAGALHLLDAGDGEPVPSLAEVLDLLAGHARLNIEIKDPAAVSAVIAATAVHPQLQWFVSTGDWAVHRRLRDLAPAAVLFPTSTGRLGDAETSLDASLAFAAQVGASGLSIWQHGLEAADVDALHAKGLQACVWTVDDPARARELLDLGVDAITTNDPATVRAVRDGVAGRYSQRTPSR